MLFVVNQFQNILRGIGFEVKLKEQEVPLWEADFVVSGEPVPTAQMQAEQMAMCIQQQKDQVLP